METAAKIIADYGILIVIAGVFLWQYIEDKKERKIERKAQSEQHDRMIEVVANNNAIVRQNSTVIERNKDINDGVIDKLNHIEKGIGELHSLVTEHTSSTEEIYARLVKEIDQLKKSSNIKA